MTKCQYHLLGNSACCSEISSTELLSYDSSLWGLNIESKGTWSGINFGGISILQSVQYHSFLCLDLRVWWKKDCERLREKTGMQPGTGFLVMNSNVFRCSKSVMLTMNRFSVRKLIWLRNVYVSSQRQCWNRVSYQWMSITGWLVKCNSNFFIST